MFSKGDSSNILHGAPVKLRNDDLVILGEGVLLAKEKLKELDPTHHRMEELIVFEMRSQTLPTVGFHWNKLLFPFELILILGIGPCAESI